MTRNTLRRMALATLVAASTLAGAGAQAAPAEPAAKRPLTPIGFELLAEASGLYKEICLDRFPDDAAVEAYAKEKALTALTDAEVKSYLHDDPGQGWYLKAPLGTYVVTLEKPPFHACAVRRMTPQGADSGVPYLNTLVEWAETKGVASRIIPQETKEATTPDGARIAMMQQVLVDAQNRPVEFFMAILTHYRGRYKGALAADAGQGTGVEIRLVRQIPDASALKK